MPKKSSNPSLADEHASAGGVAAVDRALSLLCAFQKGDQALSLNELAQRTRLYKSTCLRLLASLEHAGLMRRDELGKWALGAELARLANLYTESFSLEAIVLPVMKSLAELTGESIAFHIKQGEQRLCLFRIDSPQLLRDHVRAGDLLPLERGAGGRVLLAFSGARGRLYDTIRQDGFHYSNGDRVPGLVGVSAPVWQQGNRLLGALTLTVPEQRYKKKFIHAVCQAAEALSRQLSLAHGIQT